MWWVMLDGVGGLPDSVDKELVAWDVRHLHYMLSEDESETVKPCIDCKQEYVTKVRHHGAGRCGQTHSYNADVQ